MANKSNLFCLVFLKMLKITPSRFFCICIFLSINKYIWTKEYTGNYSLENFNNFSLPAANNVSSSSTSQTACQNNSLVPCSISNTAENFTKTLKQLNKIKLQPQAITFPQKIKEYIDDISSKSNRTVEEDVDESVTTNETVTSEYLDEKNDTNSKNYFSISRINEKILSSKDLLPVNPKRTFEVLTNAVSEVLKSSHLNENLENEENITELVNLNTGYLTSVNDSASQTGEKNFNLTESSTSVLLEPPKYHHTPANPQKSYSASNAVDVLLQGHENSLNVSYDVDNETESNFPVDEDLNISNTSFYYFIDNDNLTLIPSEKMFEMDKLKYLVEDVLEGSKGIQTHGSDDSTADNLEISGHNHTHVYSTNMKNNQARISSKSSSSKNFPDGNLSEESNEMLSSSEGTLRRVTRLAFPLTTVDPSNQNERTGRRGTPLSANKSDPEVENMLKTLRANRVKEANCSSEEFECNNGMCIPFELTCDGVSACHDGSDESPVYCKTRHCTSDFFHCSNNRCIPVSRVCDGQNSCGDYSDELNCSCGEDQFRCHLGPCISKTYRCDNDPDCPDVSDEIDCAYEAFLMFSRVLKIDSIHMFDENNPNSPYPSISDKLYMRNVIGLSYDYEGQQIFYSDIQRGTIDSVLFNGSSHHVIVEKQGSVEGLAYDPVHRELYWTSHSNSSLSRISLITEGARPEVIINLGPDDKPRGIDVDSCASRIYWTNWNTRSPSIQRAYLSGFELQSIVTTDIRMPNALSLDHKSQKLYWSDARLDKIERCNLDGTKRYALLSEHIQHPFDLAVYGDYIFWTDWVSHSVMRANKYTGSEVVTLRKNIARPMGIIAIANDTDCTQNPCHVLNSGCEDICSVAIDGRVECSCSVGRILASDGQRCKSEILFPDNKNENDCTTPQDKKGKCITFSECEAAKTNVGSRFPAICRWEKETPFVCCENKEEETTDTLARKLQVPGCGTRFFPGLNRNKRQVNNIQPPFLPSTNRGNQRPAIAGGVEAQAGAWPWMAGIYTRNFGIENFLCGSTIVSDRYIVTAAHCFGTSGNRRVQPARYAVRVGSLKVREGDLYTLESITIHPDYRPREHYNDLAVLRLSEPLRFSASVRPICLPASFTQRSQSRMVGKDVTVIGWGDQDFGGVRATILREVTVRVIEQNVCDANYTSVRGSSIPNGITSQFVCAGVPEGGKDACQRDSGGPLMLLEEGMWILVGVVSFGFQCAQPGYPGVYTRVSNFVDWLDQNTNVRNSTSPV